MTTSDIISAALLATGVTREQLFSKQRSRPVSDCRKHIACLPYRHTGRTCREVGETIGVSAHSAWYQAAVAAQLYEADKSFRRQHDAIVETLLDKKAVA